MLLFIGSLQQGLIYALLAMGVYLSFRILHVPDLTADGSFTLGVAVSAILTLAGHPLLALISALAAGGLAGLVTGFLQTKAGVSPILSGILTMSGLYTVNMAVQGGAPNLSLLGSATLFSLPGFLGKELAKTVIPVLCCILLLLVLIWFFRTHWGLCIRATGSNEAMVRASSIDVDMAKMSALAISNACISLSGAVLAQYQGYGDVNAGIGTVVIGLASVIIGEAILGRRSVTVGLLSAILGAVLYRLVIAAAIRYSVFPAYALKLVSSLLVALALGLPACRAALARQRLIRKGGIFHA
ncbi:MAG: ABC transporter permease [Intestinimonas sp.]|jgi:putative ABC transport system permease protein|nr:ABC transporter permease [Intestinimonas sp.]